MAPGFSEHNPAQGSNHLGHKMWQPEVPCDTDLSPPYLVQNIHQQGGIQRSL